MTWSNGKTFQRAFVWLAVGSFVVPPQMVLAGDQLTRGTQSRPLTQTSAAQVVPRDVTLEQGGVLVGRVIDDRGAAISLTPVSVRTGGKEIARVHSDAQGNFRVANLKGGVYEIEAIGHHGAYRLWSSNTAPPASTRGLTVVSRGDTVRGQFGPPTGNPLTRIGQFMAEHPLATAGLIGVAIAVPVAVAQDDDDPPATP